MTDMNLKNQIKKLEDYIILNRAFELIIEGDEDCPQCDEGGSVECGVDDCEESYENCPELEYFKKLAREQLEKEGVI
jgi:hypothetical protein